MDFAAQLESIFVNQVILTDNLIILKEDSDLENQHQTNAVFTEKWLKSDDRKGVSDFEQFQLDWYLSLYGFESEEELGAFLSDKKVILDAGCGLGYKAAWFAKLAPNALVIGMDFSDAVLRAAHNYKDLTNLYFIKGDIAQTGFKPNSIGYISCDQVIHHTENPDETFKHLAKTTSADGEFACYVYAKKALPRELLDDYFREFAKGKSNEELWKLSKQLTEFGKVFSELNIEIDVPEVELLGIKGGKYDLQRFIYWNFMKCFWNPSLGYETSVECNFDWYAPSNARRYSEDEYRNLIKVNNLEIKYFHAEEACYSGRFYKTN